MSTSQSEQRRQAKHEKAREAMMAEFERQKQDMAKEAEKNRTGSDRFVGKNDSIEETLKKQTVGLVRLEDFQKRRVELEEEKRREAAKTNELKPEEKKKKKKAKTKATLSFAMDEEEGDDDSPSHKAKKQKTSHDSSKASNRKTSFKNPSVDTSFLPDRKREEEERRVREELRQEWLHKQEEMKQEEIEITYSYWDGSGHRKTVKCKKGDSVAQFLEKCRQQFPELRGVSVDNMMYIKEDLIIPHHFTFYDFIVNKSRGKSGPLFNFDVHDDVRLLADASVEKDESHAGKVVERSWYNRNKHIFPASRWELFEMGKDYGSYSIHDRKKEG
ncbi:XAP5-domain-containing protein [Tilletiaria anomala UBC 951]|uniref:XAP5-domain-containing protein n=1 Tax=Tilletiaria anomala (strain ATCC 24038 / CBS 436.72 / UBC 951) TaxID=1037660 RepID=A0A066WGG1_TILAU|nr:XAP5-domain-containing protein [Tilletiaria anomala UBC 951]KDN53082.1 XAP5-domain-containing protein [Tilletiaria anomala UBC 951]